MKLHRRDHSAGLIVSACVLGLNLLICMSVALGQDEIWTLQNSGVDRSLSGISAVSFMQGRSRS